MGRPECSLVLGTLVRFIHRFEPVVIADVFYEWLYLPQPSLYCDKLLASALIGTVNVLDLSLKVSIPEKTILG